MKTNSDPLDDEDYETLPEDEDEDEENANYWPNILVDDPNAEETDDEPATEDED